MSNFNVFRLKRGEKIIFFLFQITISRSRVDSIKHIKRKYLSVIYTLSVKDLDLAD